MISQLRSQLSAHILRDWCTILKPKQTRTTTTTTKKNKHIDVTNAAVWAMHPVAGIYLSRKLCIQEEIALFTITSSDPQEESVFSIYYHRFYSIRSFGPQNCSAFMYTIFGWPQKLCINLTIFTSNLNILIFSFYYIFLIALKY